VSTERQPGVLRQVACRAEIPDDLLEGVLGRADLDQVDFVDEVTDKLRVPQCGGPHRVLLLRDHSGDCDRPDWVRQWNLGEDEAMTEAQPEKQDDEGTTKTVMVVGPDGRPVGTVQVDTEQAEEGSVENDPARLVEQPAKVMRIGSMIKQLLEEVRAAPLDEAGRARLKEIHHRSIEELEEGLAPELREELDRLSLPFSEGTPTEPELRIAQAQLVGWLEGLFHGIQAALVAQQMATRMQLEQIRRTPALTMGSGGPFGQGAQQPQDEHAGPVSGTGQYL